MITVEDITDALPKGLKVMVTQELVDTVNQIITDPEAAEVIRNNFISYTKVLQEGRYKIADYMNAVMYCSFKLMGYTNMDSWVRTFPQRYARLRSMNCDNQQISAYVAAYNRNQLVNKIMEQALIPAWIMNQHAFQEAVNLQVSLMRSSGVSDKVKTEAANSLMTHLKAPEKKQIALSVEMPSNNGTEDLRGQLRELAAMQRELIQMGVTTRTIAHQPLVRGENGSIEEAIEIGGSDE